MNSLQYGWQMEDLDEAIRTSTGRQRKQLLRQKERAALTENLQGEQTDTQRERQEELWAREDERYSKQTGYMETLMDLDEKQFDLSKEQRQTMADFERRELQRKMDEYTKQYKLQQQIQDKQREYQYEQLQLQKESAGIAAAAAKAQKDYNDAKVLEQDINETMTETFKTMVDNDPRIVLKALQNYSTALNATNTGNVVALKDTAIAMSTANSAILDKTLAHV